MAQRTLSCAVCESTPARIHEVRYSVRGVTRLVLLCVCDGCFATWEAYTEIGVLATQRALL